MVEEKMTKFEEGSFAGYDYDVSLKGDMLIFDITIKLGKDVSDQVAISINKDKLLKVLKDVERTKR